MRQLLLLRHAKSSWDDPSLPDHDRPLNARGRADAAAMGSEMRGLGLAPDIVLVSSARRTQETLALIEPFDDSPVIDTLEALYLAPARKLLDLLHAVPETARSVLVIGHNPGLHNLALALAGPTAMARGGIDALRLAERYPTAALAEFAVATPWWGLAEGNARLVRFVCPRDLPKTAP
ncbi:histidine phosphatase family protein [Elioraea tepidiphila]|jgi:phosphohistidine phosphatase|uniref:SixA phosphatase family protein n=1 Tax=Elioraea tepidiphila TaxID=457934 RepID=UPI000365CE8A|nr:histidine phosphatase family protein [Elioraea tepidiphila]